MSLGRGLVGRLQRPAAEAGNAATAAEADEPAANGGVHEDAAPTVPADDAAALVGALRALTVKKQILAYESWPAPEIALANGITVTVRSLKERRRFVRPIDDRILEWLRSLQAADVFYDIGANCGSLTLAAAGMHRDAISIVAIEPGYTSFESLVRNLADNSLLDSVIPLQMALMDRTGIAPINYRRSASAGTAMHAVGRPVDQNGNEFTPIMTQMIAAYSLDDLIAVLKLPEPTHVKIDVDGNEGPLLRGAATTLARGTISELLVEIVDHDRSGTRLAAARGLLAGHGYELEASFSHHANDSKSPVDDHLFRRRAAPAS